MSDLDAVRLVSCAERERPVSPTPKHAGATNEATRGKNPFSGLADELNYDIISYLNSQDRNSLRLVSRFFQEKVDSLRVSEVRQLIKFRAEQETLANKIREGVLRPDFAEKIGDSENLDPYTAIREESEHNGLSLPRHIEPTTSKKAGFPETIEWDV